MLGSRSPRGTFRSSISAMSVCQLRRAFILSSGSISSKSTSSWGCVARSAWMVFGINAAATEGKAATRISPATTFFSSAISARADSSSSNIRFARSTSFLPAMVSSTPRPRRSTKSIPTSCSNMDICWDTADGETCIASATAAIVLRTANSLSALNLLISTEFLLWQVLSFNS
ncbi:hypothetical protein D3C73_914570 [compost metagenome]